MSRRHIRHAVSKSGGVVLLLALLIVPVMADSERPGSTAETIRYMALGDSVAAGRGATPQTHGYVYLLYRSDVIAPLVGLLNSVILGVATPFAVPVVDVHGAFEGRTGLLLSERPGADPFEVHPTNAGHRVIAKEFRKAIEAGGGQLACPTGP